MVVGEVVIVLFYGGYRTVETVGYYFAAYCLVRLSFGEDVYETFEVSQTWTK